MKCRCRMVVLALSVLVPGFFLAQAHAVNPGTAVSAPAQEPATSAPPGQAPPPAAVLAPAPDQAQVAAPPTAHAQVAANYGRLPLYFIANRGQVDQRVKYYVPGPGHTTYFTRKEIVLTLQQPNQTAAEKRQVGAPQARGPLPENRKPQTENHKPGGTGVPPVGLKSFSRKPENEKQKTKKEKLSIVRIKPMGLQKGVKVTALEETSHRVNYFIGNNPKKWRADIPTFRAVSYENAYAGIDLKFYGQGRELEYDVIVKPGADPNQVRFAFQGIKKMELTPSGDLALLLPDGGRLLQKRPLIYQEVAGQKVPVAGRFRLCGQGAKLTCGFTVAAYDRGRPLIIDPALEYSTYLIGYDEDYGRAIAVDAAGSAYITGYTGSGDFPTTPGAFQTTNASPFLSDVFVTKLSPAGDALIYSTFLGGSQRDYGYGIAVDAAGSAYVTGSTQSDNFPVYQAFQATFGGGFIEPSDAFVTKLNPVGNALVYSTYLGRNGNDYGYGIALDGAGAAYVTGNTSTSNFPTTPNAFQSTYTGPGVFVTKMSPAGDTLAYSTCLGAGGQDSGYAIAVDGSGAAYFTWEKITSVPLTPNTFKISQRLGPPIYIYDYVAKLNPEGSALVYSNLLEGGHRGRGIAVDAAGCAFVAGEGSSPVIPGTYMAFVTKFGPDGSSVYYSTYLGSPTGNGNSGAFGIAVDTAGAAYITGYTYASNFPTTPGAFQPATLDPYFGNAFVTVLNPDGNSLAYSTYLGGTTVNNTSGEDQAYGIAVDGRGAIYVTGATYCRDFPTTAQAFQPVYGRKWEVFVTKLSPIASPPPQPLPALNLPLGLLLD